MLESKAKLKTLNFIQHIEYLQQRATDRIVDGYQETEKELIHRFTKEAYELVEQNEWGIALENLLVNINEIVLLLISRLLIWQKTQSKHVEWIIVNGHLLKISQIKNSRQ